MRVISQIQDGATVLLEGLPRKDLRKDVSWVELGRDVLDRHDTGSSHLAHLKA